MISKYKDKNAYSSRLFIQSGRFFVCETTTSHLKNKNNHTLSFIFDKKTLFLSNIKDNDNDRQRFNKTANC